MKAWLRGAAFVEACLRGAAFVEAWLRGVAFVEAWLRGVAFVEAWLCSGRVRLSAGSLKGQWFEARWFFYCCVVSLEKKLYSTLSLST